MNNKLPASFLDIHNTSVVYFLYPLNLFALCTRMKISAVFKPSDGKDNGKPSKNILAHGGSCYTCNLIAYC